MIELVPPALEASLVRGLLEQLPMELRDELDELIELEEANPLARYWLDTATPDRLGHSPGALRFHTDPSPNRASISPNKVGKTFGPGAAEIWSFLLGCHPYRRDVPVPCDVVLVCQDFTNAWPKDVSRRLRELEPPGVLVDTIYDRQKGYLWNGQPGIHVATGSVLIVQTEQQDKRAHAGLSGHVVVVNEPPEEDIMGEILRALAEHGGICSLLCTPVDARQDLRWLQCMIDGDPDTGDPPTWPCSKHTIELTPEDTGFRTQASIDAQLANIPRWELEQRARGSWESASRDRQLSAWSPNAQIPAAVHPSEQWPGTTPIYLVLVAAFGALARATAWGLFAYQWQRRPNRPPVVHVRQLAELESDEASDENDEARSIRSMVARAGVRLEQLDAAGGTLPDERHRQRDSAQLCELYGRALSVELAGGDRRHPISMRNLRHARDSENTGTRRINQKFAAGELLISDRCPRTIRAVQRWEGDRDIHRKWIDLLRIAVISAEMRHI